MADNYLITGYWGVSHVTAENDRGINAGIVGAGRFVLPVGKQFEAEYVGNNTIRMYDGKLLDNGAAAGIPAGESVDLVIANASYGMKRNDLIVFQYEQDKSTLIESGVFVVIQGVETSGTASDPELTQEDLLSGSATFDQMALWRVPVSGSVISAPVQLFTVTDSLDSAGKSEKYGAATSIDGVSYTANVDGVEELYAALTITIIPNKESASTTPTLNVNGLGAKTIRRRLSSNTATTVPSNDADWMAANKPITLQYDGTYWIADLPRTNASDLYGSVPMTKGGHGATDGAEGLANLFAAGNTVLSSYQYGTSLPAAGTKGRIFFKKVSS